MKFSSRLAVASHIILFIHVFGGEKKATSEFIASSVGVNPVIIRKTLGALKEAGIVDVKAGSGGASLKKELNKISLYDVYCAVDAPEDGLFGYHENPNPLCPVGRNIRGILNGHFSDAREALEGELKKVTFDKIVREYELAEKDK